MFSYSVIEEITYFVVDADGMSQENKHLNQAKMLEAQLPLNNFISFSFDLI